MSRHQTIEGENGALEIVQDNAGSRVGDLYLDIRGHEGGRALQHVVVRAPFIGGGIYEHTHPAIEQPAPNEAEGAARKRPPLLMISDDFDIDGSFSYLELESDAAGFCACITHVGTPTTSSGPVRFTGAEATAKLSAIYNALNRDQKTMKGIIENHLSRKQGYIYQALSAKEWDRNNAEYERHRGRESEELLQNICFSKARETGIFLLKLGIPLPEEIQERWMEKFGDLPQVQAREAKKR